MNAIDKRIHNLISLSNFLQSNDVAIIEAKAAAYRQNAWFTPEYIDLAIHNLCNQFLKPELLIDWISHYPNLISNSNANKAVGIVMAGNLPLVGFHDFLCCYISGFKTIIKLSSKDTVLWQVILGFMNSIDSEFSSQVLTQEFLKGCDAYIATGSNNSATYFKQYFEKYPSIIRQNRTSIAILDGTENTDTLEGLERDICNYFGLGCRNVSQIWVPTAYDFEAFFKNLDHFQQHFDHNKFKNNYDYQLALYLLNNIKYMSNKAFIMVENEIPFAPIATVHYRYYDDVNASIATLNQEEIQCIVATPRVADQLQTTIPIVNPGMTQVPNLMDYADGVDIMAFLSTLNK